MKQITEVSTQEPFEGITLDNLKIGIEKQDNASVYRHMLQRLEDAYKQDRGLIDRRLQEILNIDLELMRKHVLNAVETSHYHPLVIDVLYLFISTLRLVRELECLSKNLRKSEEFRKLERERTFEARTMVLEMLKIEPTLKPAIQHLIRPELHMPPEKDGQECLFPLLVLHVVHSQN